MVNRDSRESRNELRARLRRMFPRNHGELLPALHYLQHEYGYLPEWAMEVVGWHLGIPASEVYGAATSYTELRLTPPGALAARVCLGLSCRLNGGDKVMDAMETALGIRRGETAADGSATLEETACGFLCAVGPAVEVNGAWHGRVSADDVPGLVMAQGAQASQGDL